MNWFSLFTSRQYAGIGLVDLVATVHRDRVVVLDWLAIGACW